MSDAKNRPTTAKPSAGKSRSKSRKSLGTFTPTGVDSETHQCSGACGLRLSPRKFPTTRNPGVRVSECRSCRDARIARARKGKDAK